MVCAVEEGEIRHFPAQRCVPLGFGGMGHVLFRYAEHVELVEETGELFREMGMGGCFHYHPELSLMLFHESADDDLLP